MVIPTGSLEVATKEWSQFHLTELRAGEGTRAIPGLDSLKAVLGSRHSKYCRGQDVIRLRFYSIANYT